MKYKTSDRIELGVDGNCAFALLGPDIQVGECEFVEIEPESTGIPETDRMLRAAKCALKRLRERLKAPTHPWYFGPSHPYGGA